MPRVGWGPLLGAAIAILLTSACGGTKVEPLALCTTGSVVLSLDQAANAATIAAVGKRMGLPDHAVTVALATALQESGLRNLDHGDRDSLGLFQQRPSKGWGTALTVKTPYLAAATFYRHLIQVRGWEALPLTDAAQRVQHSAAPTAYAQWEDAAIALAKALTGEVPATFACTFRPGPRPAAASTLPADAVRDLGPGGLSRASTPARQWTAASWLVARASSYGVSSVRVAGRVWTAKSGKWSTDAKATALTFA